MPVGTADRVRAAIAEELADARRRRSPFAVVSNPEFLKEGAAVEDFMRPDRIVIGADDERAIAAMRAVYAPFQRNHERLLVMDVRSAELTKYAANAMLATRISFMNELANLAEALGADIEQVRQGIGSDPRIGYHFLYPGAGYGGSCFPKDVKALQHTAQRAGQPLRMLDAVEAVNEAQKHVLVDKIVARFGEDLAGRTFALWGLAFKPNTDDMREAPALRVIAALAARGAQRRRLRPGRDGRGAGASSAMRRTWRSPRRRWPRCEGADALVVVTEWKEFRSPDFDALRKALKTPLIFDGRNLYDPRWCAPPASNTSRSGGAERRSSAMAAIRRIPTTPRRRDARVLVVGDVMLDRYWFGDVERISPEAPVPVVLIAAQEERPGGAANVARNARRARRAGTLLSVIGDDEAGARARDAARGGARAHVAAPRRRAADHGQAARDRPPAAAAAHRLRDRAVARGAGDQARRFRRGCSPDCDVVVLSDYGKGGLAHIATMIERARAAGKRVLVDPKGDDWARYRGATLHHAEPQRVPRGRRPLARRGRADAQAQALRAELDARRAAGHALRGGHDPVHRRRHASRSRRRRARCTTSPARATR